ncbi:N-acetyltransferase family protein [Cellulomonas hominis]
MGERPVVVGAEPVLRDAGPGDVAAICAFGAVHVRAHYAPLIGAEAADAQVRRWWSEAYVGHVVAERRVVVAEAQGQLVGVGQLGRAGAEHAVYKLYVHPDHRGRGLGVRLLDALAGRLPIDVDRLWVEHVAANGRAAAFYEREGFTVDRVEPSSTGEPALGVVWRVRRVVPSPLRRGPA